MRSPIRFSVLIGLLVGIVPVALLSGCAMESTAVSSSVPGTALSGTAFGGQVAIGGARVYLLAANPGGYGSASLSLLTAAGTGSAVDSIGAYGTTLPNTGGFNLAGDYDCTVGYALGASTSGGGTTLRGDEQVYLYVLGGSSSGSANKNSGLLAALGPCNALYSTKLTVNELTTVAAAYAFAGFATDATHVGSSGTLLARTGLANAGLNSANLVDVSTGLPVPNSAGIARPVAMLTTLANLLAACVNGVSGNPNCTTLFDYTNSAGTTGTAATDTATAAIYLAHNPWPTALGMKTLFGLIPATGAPFSGSLASQPNDFTLGMAYSGGGLIAPSGIAIDESGDAWVSNGRMNSITELSSTGAALSGANGYTGGGLYLPQTIAIDPYGNAWTANYPNNEMGSSLSEFSNTGVAVSGANGYFGNLANAVNIAFDSAGDAWVADGGLVYVEEFSNSGSESAAYYLNLFYNSDTYSPTAGSYGIAIDSVGNVWTANYNASSASELTHKGTLLSPQGGYTGGGLSSAYSVAIDHAGYAWVANYGDNSISQLGLNCVRLGLCPTGVLSPTGGYSGGGLNDPDSIAVDGAGSLWVANGNPFTGIANGVSEFSSSGAPISPATGLAPSSNNILTGVAIDGSGDVWVSNSASSNVVELIGAATPVVTPIVANLITPYGTPASKP